MTKFHFICISHNQLSVQYPLPVELFNRCSSTLWRRVSNKRVTSGRSVAVLRHVVEKVVGGDFAELFGHLQQLVLGQLGVHVANPDLALITDSFSYQFWGGIARHRIRRLSETLKV